MIHDVTSCYDVTSTVGGLGGTEMLVCLLDVCPAVRGGAAPVPADVIQGGE